jgi:hypothetical protein
MHGVQSAIWWKNLQHWRGEGRWGADHLRKRRWRGRSSPKGQVDNGASRDFDVVVALQRPTTDEMQRGARGVSHGSLAEEKRTRGGKLGLDGSRRFLKEAAEWSSDEGGDMGGGVTRWEELGKGVGGQRSGWHRPGAGMCERAARPGAK